MRKPLIILALVLCSHYLGAQYLENEIIFDTKFHSGVKRVLEDNNQNVIVAGYTKDTAYHYSGFLLKIDPDFDTTSVLIENDTADILFTDMLVTPENNYFVIGGKGRDTGYYHQGNNIAIYIFNENLEPLSEKLYEMPEGYNYPQLFLWQAENGDIYAVGGTGGNVSKLLLLKFDPIGNLLNNNFPYLTGSNIFSVLPRKDSTLGVYAFGQGLPTGGMKRMEIDTNLNYSIAPMETNNELGSYFHDATAKWLNDSVFLFSSLVSTDTVGTPYDYEDNVLIKINENLELTDEYITVGFPQTRDYGFSYNMDWKTKDKMYVATFDAYALPGQFRYFIAMFNENLEVLGTKTISGGADIDYALWRMCATSDGGIICSGECRVSGAQSYDLDVFVHKFMPGDIVQVAEKTANPFDSDYWVYPNPGQGRLNIFTARKGVSVNIYGQNGILASKHTLKESPLNTLDTSQLPNGLYVLRCRDHEGFTENIKWIKKD